MKAGILLSTFNYIMPVKIYTDTFTGIGSFKGVFSKPVMIGFLVVGAEALFWE